MPFYIFLCVGTFSSCIQRSSVDGGNIVWTLFICSSMSITSGRCLRSARGLVACAPKQVHRTCTDRLKGKKPHQRLIIFSFLQFCVMRLFLFVLNHIGLDVVPVCFRTIHKIFTMHTRLRALNVRTYILPHKITVEDTTDSRYYMYVQKSLSYPRIELISSGLSGLRA